MWKRVEPFLAFVLAVTLASCTPEKLVTPGERLIPVQIDLQSGFGGHQVIIEVDHVEAFRALLDEAEPLAGAVARFSVHLPPGAHRLQVTWQAVQKPITAPHHQGTELVVGEAPQYYVGMSFSNETLQVRVQERPFLYAKLIGLGLARSSPLAGGRELREYAR